MKEVVDDVHNTHHWVVRYPGFEVIFIFEENCVVVDGPMDHAEDWNENHQCEGDEESYLEEELSPFMEYYRDEVDVDETGSLCYLHVPLDM